MTKRSILFAGALLCLIGMLAVPVSAIPPQAGTNELNNARIDPALKDELWSIHVDHRLDIFDRNVQAGNDAIAAVNRYGYDTSGLSGIVTTISGNRGALSEALNAHDVAALKDVNRELIGLWKDYRKEMRQFLKGAP